MNDLRKLLAEIETHSRPKKRTRFIVESLIRINRIAKQLLKDDSSDMKIKGLKFSLDFYRKRVYALEKIKDQFPEPYKTWIVNILANGRIKP